MKEEWVKLEEFPGYVLSSFGNVYSIRKDGLMKITSNRQGIAMIGMFKEGSHTTRSLAALVAEMFLPRERPAFNSPINRDGDRMNCHVDNLLWRPRWHAVHYHRQFQDTQFHESDAKLEIVETGEQYVGWKEPSIQYGLRYIDIIMSYSNGDPTFPIMMQFRRF